MEPLAEAVDPDALGAVLDAASGPAFPVSVTFAYGDQLVTVTASEVSVSR